MTNKSKNLGTFAETAVVRYAQKHGFPEADRLTLTGSKDRGDVQLDKGLMVEVKGGHAAEQASEGRILGWMKETEVEVVNGRWRFGFLVTKRAGKGPQNAGAWWAHFWLSDLYALRGGRMPGDINFDALVRMTLDSALVQARAAGFGLELGKSDPRSPDPGT